MCDLHFQERWRKKQEDQKLMDFNNDIESDPTYLYASILHLPMKFLSP